MARDRQRAKQRQAERRAARQADPNRQTPGAPAPGGLSEGAGDGTEHRRGREPDEGRRSTPEPTPNGDRDGGAVVPTGIETQAGAGLAANAPPEASGRSDTVLESPPPPPLLDGSSADADAEDEGDAATTGPVDEDAERTAGRNKVIAFLVASWAELQRVQWPTRQQTITLTGIVLGFVVIMGAYLGALDAIFSRLIELVI